jgi:hypothetical protein
VVLLLQLVEVRLLLLVLAVGQLVCLEVAALALVW